MNTNMFRNVIPRAMQSVAGINIRGMCSDVKLEKTINQVTLLGRVGSEPQKKGSIEHPVVMFSLATHSNYKYGNGDFVQRTDWHRICIFKPSLRETVLNYLKRGQRILVIGKLNYGEFKDLEGQTKASTAVIAEEVVFFQMA